MRFFLIGLKICFNIMVYVLKINIFRKSFFFREGIREMKVLGIKVVYGLSGFFYGVRRLSYVLRLLFLV